MVVAEYPGLHDRAELPDVLFVGRIPELLLVRVVREEVDERQVLCVLLNQMLVYRRKLWEGGRVRLVGDEVASGARMVRIVRDDGIQVPSEVRVLRILRHDAPITNDVLQAVLRAGIEDRLVLLDGYSPAGRQAVVEVAFGHFGVSNARVGIRRGPAPVADDEFVGPEPRGDGHDQNKNAQNPK